MDSPTDPSSAPPPDPPVPRLLEDAGSRELTTALVHFYRGELGRSNIWRTRLDATTNWAVVTTGAALTFTFGGAGTSHVGVLIVAVLVLLFLFIEARRYRYYELWTHRVRMMETHFFPGLWTPGGDSGPEGAWVERLLHSLRQPRFPISLMEALGRRYRRTYALLFLILAGSWLVKVMIHPTPAPDMAGLLERMAVGPVPGWLVFVGWFLFNLGLVALGLFTVGLRDSEGEVFGAAPRTWLRLMARIRAATREALEVDLTALKPSFAEGRKHLALIVSDASREIGEHLLDELGRGVTLLEGEGLYSGTPHGVLLCVVQGRQVQELKEAVQLRDPQAFVVITAAREVRGEGFRPLEA